MSTHANNHQLVRGHSPSFRVTFRVLNPPSFSVIKLKVKIMAQFRIFIPYLMKSATNIKVSYIIEIDMKSSNHKMCAIDILAIYTPQITSQTSGSPFISKF